MFRPISETLILSIVPAGATSGPIRVTFDGGSSTSATSFTVTQVPEEGLPVITGFLPTSGSVGVQVLITGSNLTEGVLGVNFGGVTAALEQRPEGVLATVPAGAQTGPISITTIHGVATTQTDFVVLLVPEIHSIEPMSGTTSTRIEIFGSEIADATEVLFNGVSAQFEVNPVGGSLVAIVPVNATTGFITVRTPKGVVTSSEDFVVLVASSRIDDFTPSGNPGASVVLVLSGAAAVTRVEFNGVGAP